MLRVDETMARSAYDDLHPTIIHMHIFKNAGMSIDKVFRSHFGAAHHAFDLPAANARIGVARIGRFLHDNPGCRFLTSHQIGLPLPVYEKRLIMPLVMLRDPFARVPSCFHFERDTQRLFGTEVTLDDYVRHHLSLGCVTATIGIQMLTLTDGRLVRDRRLASLDADAAAAAHRNLAALPVFGLVEEFERSLSDFLRCYARFFPGIEALAAQRDTRVNVGGAPPEARAETRRYLADALRAETLTRLETALAPELALYDEARRLFEARAR